MDFATFFGRISSWYNLNFQFIWVNSIYHVIAGLLIATILYPFLNEDFKNRKNYSLFLMFPAVFGSIFPDLGFVVYVLIKHRSLYGLMNMFESGGAVHAAFHGWLSLLVVPIILLLVAGITYLINKIKGADAEMSLPSKWWLIVSIVSLFGAILHLVMDTVGF